MDVVVVVLVLVCACCVGFTVGFILEKVAHR
jgi:hypothetical protein